MISERLKAIRDHYSLSQSKIAEKLEVSPRTYTRYESNERQPDAEVLLRLYERLEVNINWLLSGDGYMIVSDKTVNEIIHFNSLELRIKKMIESESNNFQHEIIFLYDSLEDFKENKNLSNLITYLEKAKLPVSNLLKHAITEKDKRSAIHFISSLSEVEKNYLLSNIPLFRRILWDSMAWFNRIFHKSPT